MRAKHIREKVQRDVVLQSTDAQALLALLKPYLDTVTQIFTEFTELGIEGRNEWLYDRYSEFRKMTKILLKQVLRSDCGGLDWFDAILTLSNLVGNFNLSIEPASAITADSEQFEDLAADDESKAGGAGEETLIPLCITDLLTTLLFSKVDNICDAIDLRMFVEKLNL